MKITNTAEVLGATVEEIDLSEPLNEAVLATIVHTLGHRSVIRFPGQVLSPRQLRDFAARFGKLEVNVAGSYQEPGLPEVMILSNIVENGKPIGLADAGQDWHTDMSYSRMIAFTNILYGIEIPHRDGRPLGNTEFCSMHAAYEGLPDELKRRLAGMTVLHDFNKFWEKMRRTKGSTRPPLSEAQRKAKPPVSHPIFLEHPITGKRVLYCNPGYSVRINELPEDESERMLDFLFAHQTQAKYRYAARWRVGDVLMWDNMGTIHNAVADYGPDEHRLIKRCQVMATRFFDEQTGARLS